ncbi:hypothetical protein QTO34_019376 [Cnephaeus nilssonii]|uniref:Uncharacterized protein n=1 Tax=Cnephaeus nilssonii TaxID=3371016 RepID=A0AA40HWM4_CNENI|nr:hypothetical protein QTO34_019376 [Eptesicus nilssonii]
MSLSAVFEQYQKARTQFVQMVAELATRPQNIETLQNAGEPSPAPASPAPLGPSPGALRLQSISPPCPQPCLAHHPHPRPEPSGDVQLPPPLLRSPAWAQTLSKTTDVSDQRNGQNSAERRGRLPRQESRGEPEGPPQEKGGGGLSLTPRPPAPLSPPDSRVPLRRPHARARGSHHHQVPALPQLPFRGISAFRTSTS